MNNDIQIIILKIIKFNGDLNPLLELGYSYTQILELLLNEVEKGNAIEKDDKIFITSQGENNIKEIIDKQGRKGINKWIEPEIASQIDKIDIDFVYLPSQRELFF
ncbi:hypothetical protein V9L05_18270 [Bernardetia sp. Wsw4-3y2]|uniref:hypothetical protein n=1 Tax=Bernardetia sp. Wsw4-3y2 TaxID=3127471 RepID=UPI0030D47827